MESGSGKSEGKYIVQEMSGTCPDGGSVGRSVRPDRNQAEPKAVITSGNEL
jgi:hypothetical protein